MNRLKPIKADWTNQRCNPSIIPFAGLINAPPNTSKIEYTAENFSQCTQTDFSFHYRLFHDSYQFFS